MKFYIYTLGCKVNTYESNVMSDKLLNSGYIEGNENDSNIYIINMSVCVESLHCI